MYSTHCLLLLIIIFETSSSSANNTLYNQYCCLSGNYGRTIKLRESNRIKIIICPPTGVPQHFCNSIGYYSCSDILERVPNAASGHYSITQSNGSIVSVYCDMEGSNCDGNGGWMRVGYINMTEPGATCPTGLYEYTYGSKAFCDKSQSLANGCNSAFFSTFGLSYNKVCGQASAYQYGFPDGIYPNNGGSSSIDGAYVDGISITHGNPRHHIWTYAVGNFADVNNHEGSCPCNTGYTLTLPSYVGNDWYCESGATQSIIATGKFFPNDILWDGKQCVGNEAPCCTSPKLPWFINTLQLSTTNNIEMRICSSEGYPDEATAVNTVEIYVK